jgi:hypothetical protein
MRMIPVLVLVRLVPVLGLVLVLTSSTRTRIVGRIGRVCLVQGVEFLVCWRAMLTLLAGRAKGGKKGRGNLVLVEISVIDRVCFCVIMLSYDTTLLCLISV